MIKKRTHRNKRHIRKVRTETREFWWQPRLETHLLGGTRDPNGGTHLLGETKEPRPRALKLGPETRDRSLGSKPGPLTIKKWESIPLVYMGPDTEEPEP